MNRHAQNGFFLVEHALGIALISLLVAGLLTALALTTRASADPLIQRQALAIAEAYIEEILGADFSDPDAGTICASPEAARALYDDICDYNGLADSGAHGVDGLPIAGLEDYDVAVQVTADGSAALDDLTGLHADQPIFMRIDVRVRWQERVDLSLTAYESSPALF